MAISYSGRTYEEGKKIGWKDGVRALYCIFRYNSDRLPLPMQFLMYLVVGGAAAVVNLIAFLSFLGAGQSLTTSTIAAFVIAAAANYFLSIALVFRHKARWNSVGEIMAYVLVVSVIAVFDLEFTKGLYGFGTAPWLAKSFASGVGLILNFLGRRFLVF
jgi:putative flippase GtrA